MGEEAALTRIMLQNTVQIEFFHPSVENYLETLASAIIKLPAGIENRR